MDPEVIQRWRKGLLLLPIAYLAGPVVLVSFTYVQQINKPLLQEVKAALKDSEMALQNNDLEAAKTAEDQASLAFAELRKTQRIIFLLVSILMIVVVVFSRGLWLITSLPERRIETYARWAVLGFPLLLFVNLAGDESFLQSLVTKMMAISIAIGQELALFKICELTEQQRLEKRISRVHFGFFAMLMTLLLFTFLFEYFGIQQKFIGQVFSVGYFVFGVGVVVLSLTVWELRRAIEPLTSEATNRAL